MNSLIGALIVPMFPVVHSAVYYLSALTRNSGVGSSLTDGTGEE